MSTYWDALEFLLNDAESPADSVDQLIEKGWAPAENRQPLIDLLSDHWDTFYDSEDEWRCHGCHKWLEYDNYELPDHQSSVLTDTDLLTPGRPWGDRPTPAPQPPAPPVDLPAAYQYPQRKPPLLAAAEALGRIGMDQLRDYCQDHPPTRDQCRWCNQPIITTPWYAPSGTFHMAGGGWIHEQTETSPCGPQWPYRFAEPEEQTGE